MRISRIPLNLLVAAMVVGLTPMTTHAMATECFSNTELSEPNYTSCEGLWAILNRPSMVYSLWYNGNEQFYYRGDNDDLNDALARFATCKGGKLHVILRTGPAETKSFDGKRIAYDWEVHCLGGIAGAVTADETGVSESDLPLTMTIVTTEGCIDEELIVIPESLKGAVSRVDSSALPSHSIPNGASLTNVNAGDVGVSKVTVYGTESAPEPRIDCMFPFEATTEGKRYAVPDVLPNVRITLVELDRTGPMGAGFRLVGEMKIPDGAKTEDYPNDLTIRITFYDERGRVLRQEQLCESPMQGQAQAESIIEGGTHGIYVPQFAFDLDPHDTQAKTFRIEAAEAPFIEASPVEKMVRRIGGDVIAKAAMATMRLHATVSGAYFPDIPKDRWDNTIKQMNPDRVYMETANVVIVLNHDYAGDSGIYVYMPESSNRPSNGYGGRQFTWIEGDVYSFRETGEAPSPVGTDPLKDSARAIGYDRLSEAAQKTCTAWMQAGRVSSDEIPETFWSDVIRSLRPARLYTHRANLVIVLESSATSESGLYVSLPISSFFPTNGTDGFEFTHVGGDVYTYIQTRAKAHPYTGPMPPTCMVKSELHGAAAQGDVTKVRTLIAGGADVNLRDDDGRTPLHLAAANGHQATAEIILDAGADINAKDKNGRTPLHVAGIAGHQALFDFLVSRGADKTVRDNAGLLPGESESVAPVPPRAEPKPSPHTDTYAPLKPSQKIKTLAEFDAACGEPGVFLDSTHVCFFAPKRKQREAEIVFPYLVKAYDALYGIVGGHTDYKMMVYAFPKGNPLGWGGTSDCSIEYDDSTLNLDEQQEWIKYKKPHVSGYIEEMAHNFTSATKAQFGWEMIGWSVGALATELVEGNPIHRAQVADTRKGQEGTYRRYVSDGYVFPQDIEANQCDRIYAWTLWKCEQEYGSAFWPDFFTQVRKQKQALIEAASLGDSDAIRNARYRITVACFDALPKLRFSDRLRVAHISLTTDVKSFHPTDPGWDRRFEESAPSG